MYQTLRAELQNERFETVQQQLCGVPFKDFKRELKNMISDRPGPLRCSAVPLDTFFQGVPVSESAPTSDAGVALDQRLDEESVDAVPSAFSNGSRHVLGDVSCILVSN